QVTPAAPAGPLVVITETVVASLESALRNSAAGTHCGSTSGARFCGANCGMAAFPHGQTAGVERPSLSIVAASVGRWPRIYYQSMDINYIPNSYAADLSLQHLRVLDVLLRERSLTRAAKVLDVTQPALSKTLARLRSYFDDPLFVRVSHRMEPTPKALALARPVGDVLDQMRALRGE